MTAIATRTVMAQAQVSYDADRHRLLVRFDPGDVYGGLDYAMRQFRMEFRGHGEASWRRTSRTWSMPYTPSILQRVYRWCDLMADVIVTDWTITDTSWQPEGWTA